MKSLQSLELPDLLHSTVAPSSRPGEKENIYFGK